MLTRFSQLFFAASCAAYLLLARVAAFAQYDYGDYNAPEPSLAQKVLTSPIVTLGMVLVGAACLFNLFFIGGKKETAAKRDLLSFICFMLVLFICWYRFSLWNQKKPH